METRININEIEPKAYKAMYGLEGYLLNGQLTSAHLHLIKLRASLINGCAFCIDMHTKEALKSGETQQRIFLLSAWKETDLYSEEERVILSLTEEITLINQSGISDKIYQQAEKLFDKSYLAQIIMAAVTINAWNRIAISTKLQPAE